MKGCSGQNAVCMRSRFFYSLVAPDVRHRKSKSSSVGQCHFRDEDNFMAAMSLLLDGFPPNSFNFDVSQKGFCAPVLVTPLAIIYGIYMDVLCLRSSNLLEEVFLISTEPTDNDCSLNLWHCKRKKTF